MKYRYTNQPSAYGWLPAFQDIEAACGDPHGFVVGDRASARSTLL